MNRLIHHAAWMAALIAAILWAISASAQQKTAKQCNDEWKANKASIQASGKTKKAFVADCRGVSTATNSPERSAPTGSTKTTTSTAAPVSTTQQPNPPARTRTYSTATAPSGRGQFSSETSARLHCPTDTVVWANLESHIYHFSGNRDYGNTKRGAYMCERDTASEGFRAAKNEKHP